MIERPYLLMMTLPSYIDARGDRYLDDLWYRDLVELLKQVRHLILAAPVEHREPPPLSTKVDPAALPNKLTFVDLPPCNSTGRTLRNVPRIARQLWGAIGQAEIVHGNAGGWPISFSWFGIPMAKLRRKFTMTNVESGSWRLGFQRPYRPRPLVEACLFEGLGRWIINMSDLATFTHDGYRRSMLSRRRRDRGHIFSASWIGQDQILTPEQAEASWDRKPPAPGEPLRVVFAASLKPTKGVATLLAAARLLNDRGVPVRLDVYGTGQDRPEAERAAAELTGSVRLRLRDHIPYGEPFFAMLEEHELMLVPTVSDEQPRVIYDAFARAVPVIGTATAGNAEVVADGVNGRLVPVADAAALADAVEWASQHRDQLRAMGIRALDVANSLTHYQMHYRRAQVIDAAARAKFGS